MKYKIISFHFPNYLYQQPDFLGHSRVKLEISDSKKSISMFVSTSSIVGIDRSHQCLQTKIYKAIKSVYSYQKDRSHIRSKTKEIINYLKLNLISWANSTKTLDDWEIKRKKNQKKHIEVSINELLRSHNAIDLISEEKYLSIYRLIIIKKLHAS